MSRLKKKRVRKIFANNGNFDFFGHQFYAIPDMNIMAFDAAWITMANKTMRENHGFKLDGIYDEVRESKWTIDRYMAYPLLTWQPLPASHPNDGQSLRNGLIFCRKPDKNLPLRCKEINLTLELFFRCRQLQMKCSDR